MNSVVARARANALSFLGVGFVAFLAIRQFMDPYTGGLADIYPLYHGALNLLEHGNAYHQDPPEPSGLGLIGNAYPLHAVLVVGLPLAWMPPTLAGPVFTLVVGLGWIAALIYARQTWVWLLWWPMWDALRIQQPTAVVTVAALVAAGSAHRGHRVLFVASVCAMSFKPQQTVVLIAYLVWLKRSWWRELLGAALTIAIATCLAQPMWVAEWWDRVELRSELLQGERSLAYILFPLGLIAFMRGWRLSAAAVISTGLAPWPIDGHYVASIWPTGLPWQQVTVLSLGFWTSGLVDDALLGYWTIPTVTIVALAVAWFLIPRRSDRSTLGFLQPTLG